MLTRVPLKRKRDSPRRNLGRITHDRTKPKAGAKPTAEERRHMGRIAALGCMMCQRPAEVHHVHSDGLKRASRSHRRVVPLCEHCHRTGSTAVHAIGHDNFNKLFGVNLWMAAEDLWTETCQLTAPNAPSN